MLSQAAFLPLDFPPPWPLGLSPSWYLQHVVVRDLQTCRSYHFLVDDWLSVESEEDDGLVEREVFAASE